MGWAWYWSEKVRIPGEQLQEETVNNIDMKKLSDKSKLITSNRHIPLCSEGSSRFYLKKWQSLVCAWVKYYHQRELVAHEYNKLLPDKPRVGGWTLLLQVGGPLPLPLESPREEVFKANTTFTHDLQVAVNHTSTLYQPPKSLDSPRKKHLDSS